MHNGMTYLDYLFLKHPVLYIVELRRKSAFITGLLLIGYHMSGEVMSVLSLEGRYYNCHDERARDNYEIVTK